MQPRKPQIFDIAVCQDNKVGIITKIKTVKGKQIYTGYTIEDGDLYKYSVNAPAWQSGKPTIIGSIPVMLFLSQTVASAAGDLMKDLVE